jgi:hypothetical protein
MSGYTGKTGTFNLGGAPSKLIYVYLTQGTQPTATITPIPPYIPHDTTLEALDFVKDNAMNIIGMLFLVFFIGCLGMITKAFK